MTRRLFLLSLFALPLGRDYRLREKRSRLARAQRAMDRVLEQSARVLDLCDMFMRDNAAYIRSVTPREAQ